MAGQWRNNWELVIGGAVLVVLGLLCLFYPRLTLVVLAEMAGIGLIIGGVSNLLVYRRTHSLLVPTGWTLAYGIGDLIAGALFVFAPVATSVVLPWACGLIVLAFGCLEVSAAIRMHAYELDAWKWAAVSAAVSIVLGICFFAAPGTLAVLIGLFATMQGVTLIVYGYSVHDDIIDL